MMHRVKMILHYFLIAFILSFPYVAQAQSYDINTHYEQAVPNFLEAVKEAVSEVENKEEIAEWAEDLSARLPEFLDDMISLSEDLANQGWGEYSFEPAEAFVEKWGGMFEDCPGCEEAIPW